MTRCAHCRNPLQRRYDPEAGEYLACRMGCGAWSWLQPGKGPLREMRQSRGPNLRQPQWSAEEDATLWELLEQGANIYEMADRLGRTEKAVYQRLQRLQRRFSHSSTAYQ